MGPYTELAATLGTDGICVFDAAALTALGKYIPVDKPDVTPDGMKVAINDGARVIASDILVHKNGRTGIKDLSRDSLVIKLSTLATFPDDLQMVLWSYEQTPNGRRASKGGPVIPPRGK